MRTSLSISVRRHFVDSFFFSHSSLFKPGVKVIDIGGKKKNKRGLFDISQYGADVTYVNIEEKDQPDILADAASIPVPADSYDVAVMGELLEHVPDPVAVLKEAHRILQPGGVVAATIPFMSGIHGDPYDYGRYTAEMLENMAEQAGFSSIELEQQGNMFAVAGFMVQHIFRSHQKSWRPIQDPLVRFFMWLDGRTKAPLLKAWTTGYGIILTK